MFDIIIVGGGLAGLVNAVHLSKVGLKVLVIEKNNFPKHKVCGEYISNEVLSYLDYLGLNPFGLGATEIKNILITTPSGKVVKATLPLGGFGISRFTLDNALFQLALYNGSEVVKARVETIEFLDNIFKVTTKNGDNYYSRFVIGAYGKRAALDFDLNRKFVKMKTPFLAVKSHFQGEFPEDLVALHNFDGGYCGVSKVENDILNVCYLTNYKTFKRYGNIETFQRDVVCKNPHLKELFARIEPVFPKPLTISQISFSPKKTVESHILMSGDAAGMIHPLCGNGMGMAIHSSKILSELLFEFFYEKKNTRKGLELAYSKKWQITFRKRLIAGRLFSLFFTNNNLLEKGMLSLTMFPKLLPLLIKQSHGAELKVKYN